MKNQNISDAIRDAGVMAISLGLGVTVLLVLPSVFILYALHMIYSYYTFAEEFVVVAFVLFTIFFVDFAFVNTITETDQGHSSTITTMRTDDTFSEDHKRKSSLFSSSNDTSFSQNYDRESSLERYFAAEEDRRSNPMYFSTMTQRQYDSEGERVHAEDEYRKEKERDEERRREERQ